MTKTRIKFLAIAIVVLMTVSLIPVTAFAAVGTPTVILGGVTVTNLGAGGMTIDSAKATPGSVTLTTTQATGAASVITPSGATTPQFKVAKVEASALAAAVVDTVVTSKTFGADLAGVTFADGDALVVYDYDDNDSDYKYYVIVVTIDDSAPAGGGTGRGTETLEGDSTVESVIVNVVVPTTIDYALDPLDLDGKAGQVQQVDLYTVNKTKAPILVTVDMVATAKTGITLVESPDDLTPKDMSAGVAKDIYFGLLGADSVTVGTLDYSTIPGTAAFTYDAKEAGTLAPFNAAGKASIQFALGAATETALATGDGGVASYTFYAELNTYADWKAGDLDVSAIYTFIALKASDLPATTDIAGLNVVKSSADAPAVVTPTTAGFYTVGAAATSETKNVTLAFPNTNSVTVDFWFNGETTGAVASQWQGATPSAGVLAAIHFNYTANTITVDAGVIGTAARVLKFTLKGTTYTLNLG